MPTTPPGAAVALAIPQSESEDGELSVSDEGGTLEAAPASAAAAEQQGAATFDAGHAGSHSSALPRVGNSEIVPRQHAVCHVLPRDRSRSRSHMSRRRAESSRCRRSRSRGQASYARRIRLRRRCVRSRGGDRLYRRASQSRHQRYRSTSPEEFRYDVYVGNLGCATRDDIRDSFNEYFHQIPEYASRYPDLDTPIAWISAPPGQSPTETPLGHIYVFVRFKDAILAATAVGMSGIRILGRSVRITWSQAALLHGPPTSSLDVEPLRAAGMLPWSRKEGATLLSRIWVGNLGDGVARRSHILVDELRTALLQLPEVRAKYPDLAKPVLSANMGPNGNWAFVELANEELASTAVAMAQIDLPMGCCIRTGWPSSDVSASRHAPPSLIEPGRQLLRQAATTEVQSGGLGDQQHDVTLEEKPDCDIHIGDTGDIDEYDLWDALLNFYLSLPSYQDVYPRNGPGPVVYLRAGWKSFAFARLQDPVLASTAVAAAFMTVKGRRVNLARPCHDWKPSLGVIHPPLDMSNSSATIQKSCSTHQTTLEGVLYIGNLSRWGPDIGTCRRALDSFLTDKALALPGYDVEAGPPLRRFTLHKSGRYGFARVRDPELAQQLVGVYNGLLYRGSPLECGLAATPQRLFDITEGRAVDVKGFEDEPGHNPVAQQVQDDVQASSNGAPVGMEVADCDAEAEEEQRVETSWEDV